MFTVKICNPGYTTYFTTTGVDREVLEGDLECLSFFAENEVKKILIYPHNADHSGKPELPTAERVYLINDHGKTIEIFKYS